MKKFLILVIIIMRVSCNAFAYENMQIVFNSIEENCLASGKLSGLSKKELIKILVLKPNADLDEIKAGDIVWVQERYTAETGDFSFDIKLNANAEPGEYQFIVQSKTGGKQIYPSMYLTVDYMAGLLNSLNNLSSYEEILQWLDVNTVNFELDKISEYLLWENLSQSSKQRLCTQLEQADLSVPEDMSNVNEKTELLKRIYTDFIILGKANDVDEVSEFREILSANQEKFSVSQSIEERMQGFEIDVQNEIIENLINTEFNKLTDVSDCFAYEVISKTILLASHWTEIKELFDEEADFINYDEANFEKVDSGNIYKVYSKLLGAKCTSLTDISVKFDSAVTSVLAEQNKQSESKKTNSPGSSGSGGGGTVFSPAVMPEKSDEEKEAEEMLSTIFTDIDDVPWAEEYINELAKRNVINGYGDKIFGPNDNVTRGQFVKIIVNAFGLISNNSEVTPFTDIDEADYFNPFITTAYNLGVIKGINEISFGANQFISRQDASVVISRVMQQAGINSEFSDSLNFEDEQSIESYAKEAVAHLTAAGIISGTEKYFYPQNNITRAEVAKIVFLSVEHLLKEKK